MNNQTVGERIRFLRSKEYMSQRLFAEKLGMTAPYISEIERGKRKVTELFIMVVCNKFRINKKWLLYGEGNCFKRRHKIIHEDGNDYENFLLNKYQKELAESEKRRLDAPTPNPLQGDNPLCFKNSLSSSAVFCNHEPDNRISNSITEFPQRLKALRNRNGITQLQMSEILGVSRSSYIKYERGEREPGYAALVILADYFNVSADTLLGRPKGGSV